MVCQCRKNKSPCYSAQRRSAWTEKLANIDQMEGLADRRQAEPRSASRR